MGKPTLAQIVALNKMRESFLIIWKEGQCHAIANEDVIKKFGDVEIYDLMVRLISETENGIRTFVPKFEVIL